MTRYTYTLEHHIYQENGPDEGVLCCVRPCASYSEALRMMPVVFQDDYHPRAEPVDAGYTPRECIHTTGIRGDERYEVYRTRQES